jgi:hypothetical protein
VQRFETLHFTSSEHYTGRYVITSKQPKKKLNNRQKQDINALTCCIIFNLVVSCEGHEGNECSVQDLVTEIYDDHRNRQENNIKTL